MLLLVLIMMLTTLYTCRYILYIGWRVRCYPPLPSQLIYPTQPLHHFHHSVLIQCILSCATLKFTFRQEVLPSTTVYSESAILSTSARSSLRLSSAPHLPPTSSLEPPVLHIDFVLQCNVLECRLLLLVFGVDCDRVGFRWVSRSPLPPSCLSTLPTHPSTITLSCFYFTTSF